MKLLHYLKYFLFHAIGLLSAAAVLAGGAYITIGLIGVLVIYVLGDALWRRHVHPQVRVPGILTVQLWMALPCWPSSCLLPWEHQPGDPWALARR